MGAVVRRLAAGVLGLFSALGVLAVSGVVFAPAASAHSCAVPVHVVKGRDTQVNVGVTVGDLPVNAVKIQFSPSVQVKNVVQQRPWTATQVDPTTVMFTGGQFDPQSCTTVPIVVQGTATGSFAVRAFETQSDGSVVEHPGDGDMIANPDGSTTQVNHEGTPNPAFEEVLYVDAKDSGASTPQILLAAIALPALAVVGYLLFGRRSRAATASATKSTRSAPAANGKGSRAAPAAKGRAASTQRRASR